MGTSRRFTSMENEWIESHDEISFTSMLSKSPAYARWTLSELSLQLLSRLMKYRVLFLLPVLLLHFIRDRENLAVIWKLGSSGSRRKEKENKKKGKKMWTYPEVFLLKEKKKKRWWRSKRFKSFIEWMVRSIKYRNLLMFSELRLTFGNLNDIN